MDWKNELKKLALIVGVFLLCFWLPIESPRVQGAVTESLSLVREYAHAHVLTCLVPAFFIAGAIAAFVSQASVMKYLGPKANKTLAYGVASVSGTILAVCSCTVLPLFAGIYRMGAGLGPATAFLYAGPAINVLAIVLTARILGIELGVARAVGAILFSIVIGLLMHLTFRKEEIKKANAEMSAPEPAATRPLWQNVLYFASMVGILVFANWGKPDESVGLWSAVYSVKWAVTALFAAALAAILVCWFGLKWWKMASSAVATLAVAAFFPGKPMIPFGVGVAGLSISLATTKGEAREWLCQTWSFTKQILPLLFLGVLAAGALLGRPGQEGLIPSEWVSQAVGGNSLWSNFFASVVGAFMYFATLTEVPIVQGLIASGMGKGPALALLLAGPALSLPSMIVLCSILGAKKTVVYVTLVVIMATLTGLIYGAICG